MIEEINVTNKENVLDDESLKNVYAGHGEYCDRCGTKGNDDDFMLI